MGKTTVSQHLATVYQLPILDADVYAREAVQPGSPVLAKIVDRYGAKILLPDQTLDRRQLGERVFRHPDERIWLEQQIHPYVRQVLSVERDRHITSPTIVMVIPLLFEAQMTDLVTEIWVVYCPINQQIQRLINREHLSHEQAQARINSQQPILEKCKHADLVLDNSSTRENLLAQVDRAVNANCNAKDAGFLQPSNSKPTQPTLE